MQNHIGTAMLAGHGKGSRVKIDPGMLEYRRRNATGTAPAATKANGESSGNKPLREKLRKNRSLAEGEHRREKTPPRHAREPVVTGVAEAPKQAAPSARPKSAPVRVNGLREVAAVLAKRYNCIDYLEAKGTPLQPGNYITADVGADDVIVGAMVVEVSFAHPGNQRALKIRPVVALGTWKKFHETKFSVTSSSLLHGVPVYRGEQEKLFREFFRILEHCRHGLTPVAERKDAAYTMPWQEGPVVFTVGK